MRPKKTSHRLCRPPKSRQSGAALITGLIFMVVLTMIGVTAARMSTLEERMSGNMRDRSIALQAAEIALRDAERDIRNELAPGATTNPRRNPAISGITDFLGDCGLATAATSDDGLCYSGPGVATPIFAASGNDFDAAAIATATFGDYTGAAAIPGLSAQPRYVIEGVPRLPSGESSTQHFYRITVRAQGANENTVVWLQEVFRP